MANDVFRFYSDDPELVFGYLRKDWRDAIVRWDGRKVGTSKIWLMIIVLDQANAAAAFRNWLNKYGTSGDLHVARRPLSPMVVAGTIVVRRHVFVWRRIIGWLRLRAAMGSGKLP
ncbi:hypothetical protein ACFSOZ_30460 [Mesorhizobium newzealandense]|uniref:Uncharacterized protein n=1 Tax=Mesorhizobium newzealandense TaxID=1300302 RepID=A0ABW4UM54_9HYPH